MGDGTIEEHNAYKKAKCEQCKKDMILELSEPVYRCKVIKYKNSKKLHIILPEKWCLENSIEAGDIISLGELKSDHRNQ